MNIVRIIQYLKPNAKFMVWENDIDRINWNDTVNTQPTKQEIIDAWPMVDAIIQAEEIENVAVAQEHEAVIAQTFRGKTRAQIKTAIDNAFPNTNQNKIVMVLFKLAYSQYRN